MQRARESGVELREKTQERVQRDGKPDNRSASLAVASALAGYQAVPQREDSLRRRVLAAADVLALGAAGALVWLAVPATPSPSAPGIATIVATLLLWVVLNKAFGLYDRDLNLIHKSTLDELPRLLLSVITGLSLTVLLRPVVFIGIAAGRLQGVVFGTVAIGLLASLRMTVRAIFNRRWPERCLVVGTGAVAELAANKIRAHPEYGVKVLGRVDVSDGGNGAMIAGIHPLVGEIGSFQSLCRAYRIERIVVAFSSLGDDDVLKVIRIANRLQLKISIIPRLYEVIGHAVQVDELEGMTVLGMRGFLLPRSSRMMKRALDLGGTLVGLVLLAPLCGLIALLVKLTSRGPVLFAQERIGRNQQPFRLYKFRTMHDGADGLKPALRDLNEADGIMFKIQRDPRVTPIGRGLRRLCLDELPQLWNVLRGEMSLVGPRPLVPEENHYAIDWHRTRLDLRPGLTGPWQVLGRTRIPFKEMVRLDYLYVAEWSLWRDVKLILYTLNVVLRARGC